jgi:hypothetical protein
MQSLHKIALSALFALLILPFMALSQTTKLDYFRTDVNQGQVLLSWSTFAEDGSDFFTVYASQDAQKWDKIGEVKAMETKTGGLYEMNVGVKVGVWYYKLNWKEGIYYATSTIRKVVTEPQYNILGQKMY